MCTYSSNNSVYALSFFLMDNYLIITHQQRVRVREEEGEVGGEER